LKTINFRLCDSREYPYPPQGGLIFSYSKGVGAKIFKGKYILYELHVSLNFQWDGEFKAKAPPWEG